MVATVALMSTVLHSCLLARPPIIYARPCGAGIVQAVARDLRCLGVRLESVVLAFGKRLLREVLRG